MGFKKPFVQEDFRMPGPIKERAVVTLRSTNRLEKVDIPDAWQGFRTRPSQNMNFRMPAVQANRTFSVPEPRLEELSSQLVSFGESRRLSSSIRPQSPPKQISSKIKFKGYKPTNTNLL